MTKIKFKLFFCFLIILIIISNGYTKESLKVVVFPFKNITEKPEDNWLSNSFPETLTIGLSQVKDIILIEKNQINNILKTQTFSQSVLTDEKTAIKLGKILNANIVVVGSYQKLGDQIRIIARFVDVITGEVKKDHIADVTGKFEKLFDLQNQLSEKLISSFDIKTTPQENKSLTETVKSANSIKSYEYYIKGKEILDKVAFNFNYKLSEEAVIWFKQAISEDKNYALAYTDLSRTYLYQAIYAKQKDELKDFQQFLDLALENALIGVKLKPNLVNTHSILALIYNYLDKKDKAISELEISFYGTSW